MIIHKGTQPDLATGQRQKQNIFKLSYIQVTYKNQCSKYGEFHFVFLLIRLLWAFFFSQKKSFGLITAHCFFRHQVMKNMPLKKKKKDLVPIVASEIPNDYRITYPMWRSVLYIITSVGRLLTFFSYPPISIIKNIQFKN